MPPIRYSATMKITATTTTSARSSMYSKRRSPSPTTLVSLTKRRESPLTNSLRRTPPQLVSVEMQRQAQLQMGKAEREMQALLEVDYRDDVKLYMYEMEAKTTASVELIDQQPELQWYMRPYLVDFLIEIHQQHRLRPETLYLALNIVDRYVSKRIVFKKHYQLVGCAALWIAAKFEDAKDRVPTVPELCQMCCNQYEESAFLQMEGHVLRTIGWLVGHPTSEAWLRLACVTGPGPMEEARTQHVARFIMELTLFHKEYIPYKASDLALASLMLARFMLGKSRRVMDETTTVLQITSMLDRHLAEHLDDVSVIVVQKYSFPFYSRASTFVREWFLSGRRFSYFDWTHPPTTPARQHSFLAKSTPAAPSSVRLVSSSSPCSSLNGTPSSASSSDDYDDDDDDDDDDYEACGPHTPLTPLPPYSTADPFSAAGPTAVVGKENLPRPSKTHLQHQRVELLHQQAGVYAHAHASRPPLAQNSWDVNAPQAHAIAHQIQNQQVPHHHAMTDVPTYGP